VADIARLGMCRTDRQRSSIALPEIFRRPVNVLRFAQHLQRVTDHPLCPVSVTASASAAFVQRHRTELFFKRLSCLLIADWVDATNCRAVIQIAWTTAAR